MKAVKKAAKVITEIENWLVILTFVAMIVVVMAIVLCRYVFNISFTSGEEIARYLMIWCGYGGAALGFREHAHVGVEVFAGWFPKKWKPTILKLRHILSTIVVAFLFVFACIKFVQYLKLPFFPSYAAYTFPFVISAIATKQLMVCSMNMGSPMPFLKPIVLIETIIATITMLYALIRYLIFLFAPAKAN